MIKPKISNKDYFYLAKQSVKSRKKSTRTTVRGIAFGLILILPVLFFAFSFYLDFNTKINQQKTVSLFQINTTHQFHDKVDRDTQLLNFNAIEQIPKDITPEDAVYFENYEMSSTEYFKLQVNNSEYKTYDEMLGMSNNNNNDNNNHEYFDINRGISAVHYDKSGGKMITDSLLKDFKGITHRDTIFTEGAFFTAETKGAKEIIIAQNFASKANIKAGDTLSMKYSGQAQSNIRIDNDNDPDNVFDYQNSGANVNALVLDNFTVVGILDEAYYGLVTTRQDAWMIISDTSLYSDSNELYAPILRISEIEEDSYMRKEIVATYTTSIAEVANRANADGKLMLGYGFAITPRLSSYNGFTYSTSDGGMSVKAQFKDYNSANKATKYFGNVLKMIDEDYRFDSGNQAYDSLQLINMIGTIVVAVFAVFGGVILLATMLNLYNSIQYSVESRRNYMGMLRAIGSKPKNINRLYFTEIFIIFRRALVWAIIIGGGICIGIKFLFDMGFAYVAEMFPIALSLSLWYLPVVLGAIFLFTFFIGWLYSRICCKQLTKCPILNVLKEDR